MLSDPEPIHQPCAGVRTPYGNGLWRLVVGRPINSATLAGAGAGGLLAAADELTRHDQLIGAIEPRRDRDRNLSVTINYEHARSWISVPTATHAW